LLADHGAQVIKIEHPIHGDPLRQWSPMKDGISLWWKVTARNKRAITLDLASPTGRDIFVRLATKADAVIENFRPGTFARWGLTYDVLAAANPRLILAHISGYGQTGPYANRPGYGTVAEALSGVPSFTGFPANPPTLSAFPLVDELAGVFAAFGVLAAVYERDTAGSDVGQEIDVSLYEPLFRLTESQVAGYDQLGLIKQRVGNRLEEDSPRNVYKTRDGKWIAVSASSDRTFARLAGAIGMPQLAHDARFHRNPDRIANADILDDLISRWIIARSADEVLDAFEAADVVAGPIYTIEDIFDDPHYRARGSIIAVEDPDFGSVKMPAPVPRFSRSPSPVFSSGPRLGQHTEEVLRELGLTEAEIRAAQAGGAI